MAGHRSSAWPLAAACVCLITYASLHPFAGWEPPPPTVRWWWLAVPQPRHVSRFDLVVNLLAYLPLGMLLAAGLLRAGSRYAPAFGWALLAGSALSYGLETLQHWLPQRVPSVIDWGLNSVGAGLGALAMLLLHGIGTMAAWDRWRERWLLRGRGVGLALLLLWPFGLLFPPPLPFGLGQVLGRARELLIDVLQGTAWDGWLRPGPPPVTPLAPGVELIAVAAGLLAPCLLAYALTRPGLRRLVLPLGALALGLGATTLSTVLSFGPEHALTWLTPPVLPAIGVALGVAVLLAWVQPRSAAAVGLVVISFGLALVNAAPSDAYYAASLQAWEQGRFIRFHGLTQWIGWLWPWATLAYLLARAVQKDEVGRNLESGR